MDMIKRLHRKFILIATAAIFTIVAVALGVINGTLYYGVRAEIHAACAAISENGGSLGAASAEEGWLAGSAADDTPEYAYQTRYFSVLLDRDGTAKVINVNHIAAFNEEEAVETAVSAVQTERTEGFFKRNRADYAYKISQTAEGDLLVVILDCTRDMAAVRAMLRYSTVFGLLCIAAFVAIVTVLSKRAIRPFRENLENQKRFITNAGHELKTPVAIISANAEALELISGANEWTGNILKQVRRLTGLIDDLVLLAKVGEASKRDIHLVDVDLTAAAESAAESFRPLAADQGKTLTAEISENLRAKAEPRFVGELLSIFLDNAVKYCDEGGAVTLTAGRTKKGNPRLAVSNAFKDGAGVDYSRFFERFYRGDDSHASGKSGYGIGLSMAADMAKLMDAKLSVTWENGVITFAAELKNNVQ